MCPNDQKTPNPPISAVKRFPDKPDGHRNPPDVSNIATDVPSIGSNMKMAKNMIKIIRGSPNGPEQPNLLAGSATSCSDDPNGIRDHTDALSTCTDGHSVTNDVNTATNATKIVRASPNEPKMQNSPSEAARQHSDEPNTCGNLTNGSSARMGSHSIETNARTPANKAERVRMCQIDPKS